MAITSAAFWAALGSIILANLLLSGDNAVVIAMAARSLPAHQQKKAIAFGSAAAIVLRVMLTWVAVEMLKWPFLKIAGGVLLLYLGVTLLLADDDAGDQGRVVQASLLSAVRTILIADLVMSLDNVLAVAAAAKGNPVLLVLGLSISVPLIIFGSTLLLRVMARWPVIITLGAALLGFLAGELIFSDSVLARQFGELPPALVNAAAIAGAVLVVLLGKFLQRRRAARQALR